jgi:transposase-like protein
VLLETLIQEPICASILINHSPESRERKPPVSEFGRVNLALEAICSRKTSETFFLFGRAYSLVPPFGAKKGTRWTPNPSGGGEAVIVLCAVDEPAQQIRLEYKVALEREKPDGENRRAWLTVDFNPTTIMTGNNVFPATIADSETGEIFEYPSSTRRVIAQCLRLGFEVLEQLAQQADQPAELYCDATRKIIRTGRAHICHAQWCVYLPTSDVAKFLQLMTLIYGHTITSGKGIISLSEYLGCKFDLISNGETHEVDSILLRRQYGAKRRKPLMSGSFYNKSVRVAQMHQTKTLSGAETAAVNEHVRFDITAHSEGIIRIVQAAQQRLTRWLNEGLEDFASWQERFVNEAAKPQVWWLERAIYVLSHHDHDDELVRGSFSDWLVDYMLDEILCLKVIANFKSDDYFRLIALDDAVAKAWYKSESVDPDAWVVSLAKAAGRSNSTVYNRRREWRDEYNVDIAIPHAFYRDLLFFGSHGLTAPELRSVLIESVKAGFADQTVSLLANAAADFDAQRAEVVATTINSAPLAMAPKVVLPKRTNRISQKNPMGPSRKC